MISKAPMNAASHSLGRLHPPLFEGLSKSEVDLVIAAATHRKYARGLIVATVGEPADQLFLLLSGRARYFTLTEEGRRVLLRGILPGELFGGSALLHKPSSYLVSTEAVKGSEFLAWNRADIRRLASRYPRLLENALTTASDYLTWYVTAHLALISRNAPQRLARVLFHLASDIGRHTPAGIELDVTNEELADAANITRFTTSRLLSEWRHHGVLAKRRSKVVLCSPERLFLRKPLASGAPA